MTNTKTPYAPRNTEEQLVRQLRALEKSWPKGYWLFSASGSLHLMRHGPDGKPVMLATTGGVDPAMIVASFGKIDNDGGDW